MNMKIILILLSLVTFVSSGLIGGLSGSAPSNVPLNDQNVIYYAKFAFNKMTAVGGLLYVDFPNNLLLFGNVFSARIAYNWYGKNYLLTFGFGVTDCTKGNTSTACTAKQSGSCDVVVLDPIIGGPRLNNQKCSLVA